MNKKFYTHVLEQYKNNEIITYLCNLRHCGHCEFKAAWENNKNEIKSLASRFIRELKIDTYSISSFHDGNNKYDDQLFHRCKHGDYTDDREIRIQFLEWAILNCE